MIVDIYLCIYCISYTVLNKTPFKYYQRQQLTEVDTVL